MTAYSISSMGDLAAITTVQDATITLNFSWSVVCPPKDVSQRVRYVVDVVFYTGLTTLACLMGGLSNIVNCVVFWRQGLQDRMNLCLFSLALTDGFYLISVFIIFSVSSFIRFYDEIFRAEYYSKTIASLGGLVYGIKAISGCFNMIIAVERCICVVFPHLASTLMQTRTMGVLLSACVLLFQGLYLIYPLSYHAVLTKTNGRAIWAMDSTRFYEENKVFIYTFLNTILETVVPVVTFCVVSISTAVTVRTLRASIVWRGKTTSATNDTHIRQVALTRMLVMVSCVYITSMTPFMARKISFWFLSDYFTNTSCLELFMAASAAVFTVSILSSCFNFFVYLSRSSRYRATLAAIVLWIRGHGMQQTRENDSA